MANDKDVETTPEETTPEPTGSERKAIAEAYAKASKKDKLTKFFVDPTTKTLRKR